MVENDRLLQRWNDCYRAGTTPWDSGQTPPEVVELFANGLVSAPGFALDLGAGTGTNVAWLAAQGLSVVGVEYSSVALQIALERLANTPPPVRKRIGLTQADASRVPFSKLQATYILDIGCLHTIPPASRANYAHGVVNNLASNGYYHLFAFDRVGAPIRQDATVPWRGMDENEVVELFQARLDVVDIQRGNPDRAPCRWYLLRKP